MQFASKEKKISILNIMIVVSDTFFFHIKCMYSYLTLGKQLDRTSRHLFLCSGRAAVLTQSCGTQEFLWEGPGHCPQQSF